MSAGPSIIEWAVIEREGFRGIVRVHKGGLGSQEEAEAWLAALELARKRAAFEQHDEIRHQYEMTVAWRAVPAWQSVPSRSRRRRSLGGRVEVG